MTSAQDRSPGPLEPARENGYPTVCAKPIHVAPVDLPCILRKGHNGPCERLRRASGVYDVVAFIEPASGAHDRCDLCYKTIEYGQWKLTLPETHTRYDGPLTICRTCAGDLGRHLLTFPAGPAPDPADSSDPDDWYPRPSTDPKG